MQTSIVDVRSHLGQTSRQDVLSNNQQTSEVERKSFYGQTSNIGDPDAFKNMECQTDPKITRKKTPIRRAIGTQIEKPHEVCKQDWADSLIYRRALKEETERRGLVFEGKAEDTDDESNYSDESKCQNGEAGNSPQK